jgi:hypothetical protein
MVSGEKPYLRKNLFQITYSICQNNVLFPPKYGNPWSRGTHSEHIYDNPYNKTSIWRKKRIIKLFINPVDGGKITLKLNKHGWEKCDFTVRSTMKTIESLIKSVGGDEIFIQRLFP